MPSQQVVSHPANAAMFLVYTVDGSDAADSAAETRAPRGGKRSRTEPAHRADEGFFGPGSVAWKA